MNLYRRFPAVSFKLLSKKQNGFNNTDLTLGHTSPCFNNHLFYTSLLQYAYTCTIL